MEESFSVGACFLTSINDALQELFQLDYYSNQSNLKYRETKNHWELGMAQLNDIYHDAANSHDTETSMILFTFNTKSLTQQ